MRGGNVEAIGEIFLRYRAVARRIASRVADDSGDVDDIVSEAFVRIIAALRNGKGPTENLAGYLSITIRRVHIDFAKTGQWSIPVSDLELHARPVEFFDPVIAASDLALAEKALSALPDRWQRVLWLVDVDGLSPAQAGLILDIAPNAVSALVRRARIGLKKEYLQAYMPVAPTDDCRSLTADISQYVLGSGSLRSRRRVECDLSSCSRCAAVVAELRELGVNRGLLVLLFVPFFVGWEVSLAKIGGIGKAAALAVGESLASSWKVVRAWVAVHTSAVVATGAGLSIVAGGAGLVFPGGDEAARPGVRQQSMAGSMETSPSTWPYPTRPDAETRGFERDRTSGNGRPGGDGRDDAPESARPGVSASAAPIPTVPGATATPTNRAPDQTRSASPAPTVTPITPPPSTPTTSPASPTPPASTPPSTPAPRETQSTPAPTREDAPTQKSPPTQEPAPTADPGPPWFCRAHRAAHRYGHWRCHCYRYAGWHCH
ncbi:hypothetical protein GCM10027344_13650 [Spelaeicoccus albus]